MTSGRGECKSRARSKGNGRTARSDAPLYDNIYYPPGEDGIYRVKAEATHCWSKRSIKEVQESPPDVDKLQGAGIGRLTFETRDLSTTLYKKILILQELLCILKQKDAEPREFATPEELHEMYLIHAECMQAVDRADLCLGYLVLATIATDLLWHEDRVLRGVEEKDPFWWAQKGEKIEGISYEVIQRGANVLFPINKAACFLCLDPGHRTSKCPKDNLKYPQVYRPVPGHSASYFNLIQMSLFKEDGSTRQLPKWEIRRWVKFHSSNETYDESDFEFALQDNCRLIKGKNDAGVWTIDCYVDESRGRLGGEASQADGGSIESSDGTFDSGKHSPSHSMSAKLIERQFVRTRVSYDLDRVCRQCQR